MALSRLCSVIPADADGVSEKTGAADRDKHGRRTAIRAVFGLTAFARRSLHWFFRRRYWHSLRRCLLAEFDHDHASSEFEDISGDDPNATRAGNYSTPRIFSYAELYIGTKGFSEDEILGTGGFGRVYRAVLPSDGTEVAVKCVRSGLSTGQIEKTFSAELAAVAQLRHRNLVRLRGWCVHETQLLLVYDYMPNSSLDRLLFTPPPASSAVQPVLDWERRRRIVSGLAAALFYLHEQLDTQIIHRDVKASNIMLDAAYNARLGDFGLARWLEHHDAEDSGNSFSMRSVSYGNNYQFRLSETSRIGGTIGYLPPESFHRRTGGGTAKCDVFSFGVVALEVATGRRAVDLAFSDDRIVMLDWVRRLADEGKCLSAGDHRLPDGSYSLAEMERLIQIGLLCSLHDPKSRPTMKWVIEVLSSDYSGMLPALPSFQSHPQYISFSSSSSSAATGTSFSYHTAAATTVFLTADNGRSATADTSTTASKPIPLVDTPREIPFKEILAITENFSESRMVAELDFGTGYEGYMENGKWHVLVKRLGMRTCPALRARFSDELKNVGRLRHRHLVQLRGWCTEQGEMLAVYDYSARSVLSHHLFFPRQSGSTRRFLSWNQRYTIVKSLASAVLYLHEEWDEQVIHRNITSSAVFLDADKSPRLGCFALAEFLQRNEHGQHAANFTSSARGIFGYMSPEYLDTGDATPKADVYSFGVVVLEIISGIPAVDFRTPDVLLVKKVKEFEAMERSPKELADRRIDGEYDGGELRRLVELGMACTRSNPSARPSMRQLVSILDGNDELLRGFRDNREGKEEWEGNNATCLSLARRMQALGVQ